MSHLKISILGTAVLAAFLLSACGEKSAAKDAHGPESNVEKTADEHGHSGEGEKITHYTDKSELFVEFPALVAGEEATLVAHFTTLADFKPVAAGRLTAILSGGGAPEERFTMEAPGVPGIYKLAVTPKAAGERNLTLAVESAQGELRHELGEVDVFADDKAAEAGHGGHEHEGHGHDEGHGSEPIAFSKEQQWKVDFATAEAVQGRVRVSVSAIGTIRAQPDGEALIVAPAAGTIRPAGSFPRVGQPVRKGQVLAYFSPRLGGETDYAALEAGAARARIALEQARRERERMESLFKDEAVAEKRLIEARAGEDIAAAEHEAARKRLMQLGDGSGGIALRAPVDGTVADVPVAAGAFAAEGSSLIHIASTNRLWLDVRVPESDIGRLGKPSGAWFAVDGFAERFSIESGANGRLVAVGNVVDAATRTVPVIFEFANPDRSLPLGMTARVQLFADEGHEGIVAPAGAVQDENGASVVYVQADGESFERRLVEVGARDGERVEIRAGLESGERVVSKGAYLIRLSTAKSGASGHAGHAH